jgi:adenylate cyclase
VTSDEIAGPEQIRGFSTIMRRLFGQFPGSGDTMARLIDEDPDLAPFPERQGLLKALTRLYDRDPHRYLNFYGPPGTIATVPYQAVIKGGDPNLGAGALDFNHKVVFVGFSDLYDPGQPDRFYTVFTRGDGVDLSGVEIAATAFANLLTDRTLRSLGAFETAILLVLFGLVLGTMVYLLPALAGVPASLALVAAYALAAQWIFGAEALWLPLATPLLAQFPAALFLGLFAQYRSERRRTIHLSGAINYYLPENIARDLTENRLDPSAANQVVYGVCLATDMAGFSTIAEQLEPGELASFLNEYFDALAKPLKRHRVDVTEFRADAIMCAWTAASPEAGARQKAVLAALEAADAIADFKERHHLLGNRLRIGIESGWVYVGHAGGGGHFVYSIVGDCANTASRIEGLNKHLGTQLLATESVVEGLDNLLLRPLGSFQFVGKTEALPIVEILSMGSDASAERTLLCERFSDAIAAYQSAQWDKAADRLEAILQAYPDDGPSRFYLTLCHRYRTGTAPPEDPRIIRMEAK